MVASLRNDAAPPMRGQLALRDDYATALGGGDIDVANKMVGQVLRASSEVFASALRESTGRGDEAVAERERTAALLELCEASLHEHKEEAHSLRLELRETKAALREAQDALLRIEAFIGAAQMQEARRHRGWLSSLAPKLLRFK